MPIHRKSSSNIVLYEKLGQLKLFGRDNLAYKTVNLPNPQKYINICSYFKIKKLIKKSSLQIFILLIKI